MTALLLQRIGKPRKDRGGGSGAITQTLQIPVTVLDKGRTVSKIADVSPCLMARDYKGFSKKAEAIAVIEERKELGT